MRKKKIMIYPRVCECAVWIDDGDKVSFEVLEGSPEANCNKIAKFLNTAYFSNVDNSIKHTQKYDVLIGMNNMISKIYAELLGELGIDYKEK